MRAAIYSEKIVGKGYADYIKKAIEYCLYCDGRYRRNGDCGNPMVNMRKHCHIPIKATNEAVKKK